MAYQSFCILSSKIDCGVWLQYILWRIFLSALYVYGYFLEHLNDSFTERIPSIPTHAILGVDLLNFYFFLMWILLLEIGAFSSIYSPFAIYDIRNKLTTIEYQILMTMESLSVGITVIGIM